MSASTGLNAELTFAEFAPFYDRFTAHHEYDEWTATLERLARHHGLRGRRFFDIACGTGKSFAPMLQRGYEVTACDISPQMLAGAEDRSGGRAHLFVADMRELPAVGTFDLVTCLDEPINYLLAADEVAMAFRGVSANLAPGGVFVFDLNTTLTYRTVFATDDCYEQEGWFFVWRGEGDTSFAPGDATTATVEAFEPAGECWRRRSHTHTQRHYPQAEVEALLAAADLDVLGVYGITTAAVPESPADEARHTKFVYIAGSGGRAT